MINRRGFAPRSITLLLTLPIVLLVVGALGLHGLYVYRIQSDRLNRELREDVDASLVRLTSNRDRFAQASRLGASRGGGDSTAANPAAQMGRRQPSGGTFAPGPPTEDFARLIDAEMSGRHLLAIVVGDLQPQQGDVPRAIGGGRIRDHDGAVIEFDDSNPAHREALAHAVFSKSAVIDPASAVRGGAVTVYASDRSVRPALRQTVLETLALLVGLAACLSAIVLVYTRRLLVLPLQRLVGTVTQRGGHGLTTERLPRFATREMTGLAEALEDMLRFVRESQQNLQHQHARLQYIIEGTQVGTWEWNVQTGELVLNEHWAEILGYTLSELQPVTIETWKRLAHPFDLAESTQRLERHFSGRSPYYEMEARMRHKDGRWVWVLDRGKVASRDLDGKPLLMSGTHQDITERKLIESERAWAESELTVHRDQLETLVQLRTRELQQEKERAEDANHAKSAFLANMSHEIRTPLNALLGLAYMLQHTQLTHEQREQVEKIRTAGQILRGQVSDILDLTKIESGEMSLEQEPFSLSKLLDDLRGLVISQAETKGLTLSVGAVPEEVPEVLLGDPLRVRQILLNLLNNAVKFTERGSVSLGLRRMDGDTTPGSLRLRAEVIDSGIGISPDLLGAVFQPFTQKDSSTTRRFGGTGLGLTIVKQLAECMNGSVDVVSREGEGSIFGVELVLGVVADPAQSREQHARRQLQLLIADDDDNQRTAFATMAAGFGWAVECVADGKALVERVLQRARDDCPVDCILTDWRMPQLDGLEALHKMTQVLGPQRVPAAIVITVHELQHLRQSPHAHLPDSVLIKPVNSSRLFNEVNAAVVKHGGQHQLVIDGSQLGQADVQWLPDVHVLLVDDSAMNLDVAGKILQQQGARVSVCGNGAEALNWLFDPGNRCDLVLMDIQMPVMDGNEAVRELRKEARFKELPILALTAGALRSERDKALEAGVNDYLTKPLDPDRMVRLIRHSVEKARGSALAVGARTPGIAADAAWPELPGIDTAQARLRLSDDLALFRRSLRRFLDEWDAAGDLTAQLSEPDEREALARRMHKLAGNGALIGAQTVHHLAKGLETALHGVASDDLSGDAAELTAETGALALVAERWLAETPDPDTIADAASAPTGRATMAEFRAQLQSRKIAALQTYKALAPALRERLGVEGFAALHKALDELDFVGALGQLDAIDSMPAPDGVEQTPG